MQSAQTRGPIDTPETRKKYLQELWSMIHTEATIAAAYEAIRYLYMRETYIWMEPGMNQEKAAILLRWFRKSCHAAGIK